MPAGGRAGTAVPGEVTHEDGQWVPDIAWAVGWMDLNAVPEASSSAARSCRVMPERSVAAGSGPRIDPGDQAAAPQVQSPGGRRAASSPIGPQFPRQRLRLAAPLGRMQTPAPRLDRPAGVLQVALAHMATPLTAEE